MLWCDKRSQRIRTLAKEKQYSTYANGFQGDITVTSDGKTYSITTQKEAEPLCEQIANDKGGCRSALRKCEVISSAAA
jgi:hypothetical protein